MARTAIATLQTVWDCRWSRPGLRLTGVHEDLQPEPTWVCVRDGHHRAIQEDDCATCAFWELDAGQPAATATVIAAPVATPASAPVRFVDRAVHLFTWGCILLMALILGAVGLSILTSPYAIPVTVTLWLTGAALIGLAATGHLDARR
jgi:hypothetical protein